MILIASTSFQIPLILDNYKGVIEYQFVWKLVSKHFSLVLIKPGLHEAICLTDSFVFTPGHCVNF